MKQLFLVIITMMTMSIMYAQAPQGMNYQAIVRDATGTIIANKNTNLRIVIIDSMSVPPGDTVYQEEHKTATNEFGLVNLTIGNGIPVIGSFSNINWSSGNKHIAIAVDPEGGQNFIPMGQQQLLSVPYALYAETSGGSGTPGPTGPPGVNGVTGPTGPQGIAGVTGSVGPTGSPGMNGSTGPMGAQGLQGPTGPQGDPATDDQTLSLLGDTLSISGGNFVVLSPRSTTFPNPPRVFTSSGTYTVPPDVIGIIVEVVGGGGGGHNYVGVQAGGGGGGGGYSKRWIATDTIPTSIPVTVGSGGMTSFPGFTGDTSSFGNYLYATGGEGGNSDRGGRGGIGVGGHLNFQGSAGQNAQTNGNAIGGAGGDSHLGGGGLGGGAGNTLAGEVGGNYGAGGGGALNHSSNPPGGAGANGVVIITEYYH